MKNFKIITYVLDEFPVLEQGTKLDVKLKKENKWIGTAVIEGISNEEYLLDFSLSESVSGGFTRPCRNQTQMVSPLLRSQMTIFIIDLLRQ